jgi:hypothetical protein
MGDGQGFVDIRERLVHLLVFYYNMVKIVLSDFSPEAES